MKGPSKDQRPWEQEGSPTFSEVPWGNNSSISRERRIYGRSVGQAPPRPLQTQVPQQVRQNEAGLRVVWERGLDLEGLESLAKKLEQCGEGRVITGG